MTSSAEFAAPSGLFIDGEFVPPVSGRMRTIRNPATGRVVAEVADAAPADVDRAVSAARSAFDSRPWREMMPFERGRILRRIAERIAANAEEIARCETLCGGKTIANSRNEVEAAIRVFEYYSGAMDKFFGDTIPMGSGVLDFTLREPVGVVAQITPWNFPFLAAAWKVAPALAAGCTSILKPASNTPVTALLLARAAAEADLPPGVLNVLPGPGAEFGDYFARHPGIDKIAFTGATRTGAFLLKAAADDLKRVSLELGGKSPNIIFADADLDKAADAAVKSGFGNAGQSCSARTRIIVEASVHDAFVRRFEEVTTRWRVGDPMDAQTQMGPLVSEEHWASVKAYVELGLEEGAELLCGGDRPTGLKAGSYFAPTIFVRAHNDMRIAREEIFGPVVAVIPFFTEAEAVRLANDNEYGLNASVWTRDAGKGLRVCKALQVGMVSLNSHGSASRYGTFAPFGGCKKSGLGRELGMHALDLYTEVKNVFVDLEP
jgi:betaine-aldehyde dehydrogenase